MFGYVKESVLTAESIARAKAEARAEELSTQVGDLKDRLDAANRLLSEERARSTDVLDRFVPRREQAAAADESGAKRSYTSETARHVPAIGKTGMHQRRQEVSRLAQEEREGENAETRRRRESGLTDEERRSQGLSPREAARIDPLLGIDAGAFSEPEKTTEDEKTEAA